MNKLCSFVVYVFVLFVKLIFRCRMSFFPCPWWISITFHTILDQFRTVVRSFTHDYSEGGLQTINWKFWNLQERVRCNDVFMMCSQRQRPHLCHDYQKEHEGQILLIFVLRFEALNGRMKKTKCTTVSHNTTLTQCELKWVRFVLVEKSRIPNLHTGLVFTSFQHPVAHVPICRDNEGRIGVCHLGFQFSCNQHTPQEHSRCY